MKAQLPTSHNSHTVARYVHARQPPSQGPLIACHHCDLIQHVHPFSAHQLRCARCGSILYRERPNSLNRCLALIIAGILLFIISNSFPFLAMETGIFSRQTTLLSGIYELWHEKLYLLSMVVLTTCFLIPFGQMLGLMYILVPLQWNKKAWPYSLRIFRWVQHIALWSMLEVFLFGILVALVKLSKMAAIIPGISAYSFAALTIILTAALSHLDTPLIWKRLSRQHE